MGRGSIRKQDRRHIGWHGTAADNGRPEFQGRRGDQARGQRYVIQVVVEMLAVATMAGMAEHMSMAFAIAADPTKIVSCLIGKENVGPEIDRLRLARSRNIPSRYRFTGFSFLTSAAPVAVSRLLN